jgi:hypothetical protein
MTRQPEDRHHDRAEVAVMAGDQNPHSNATGV